MKVNTELISKIIKELGISANLSGYYYIRYAIGLTVSDITLVNGITTVIYPTVAKEFDTTPTRVEKGIRHAIENGWVKANYEFADKLFGYSVDARKGKPTNSEFISTVADYILMTQDCSGKIC